MTNFKHYLSKLRVPYVLIKIISVQITACYRNTFKIDINLN